MARPVGKRRRTIKRKSSWFFWACIAILIDGTEKVEEIATCAATIPAISGSQSFVHCYFPNPLKANETFSVELHQLIPGRAPRRSLPLDCYNGESGVQCTKGVGYDYSWENRTGLTVKLTIKNASQSHSGRYVCKKTSLPLGNHKGCMLNVKEKGLTNRSTSCHTTGQKEGQPSTVKCHLTEDPRTNRHYFKVLRFDSDKTNPLPKIILDCHWPPGETKAHCEVADGYAFDDKVDKVINVVIVNTTKLHEGKYFCDDASASPDNIKFCDLKIKDLQSLGSGNKMDNKYKIFTIVIAVLSAAVICSLLTIGFVYLMRKKKRPCTSCGGKGSSIAQADCRSPMIRETHA